MIIRRRHTANFTTISNVLFEDDRLSADEVGILAYLLSRPHDWEVRRPALQRRWGIGREAMKRIVTAWIKTGWCRPERTRLPNGTYYMIYDIRDVPGVEMTDDEVRRALSLVSSEATSDDIEAGTAPSNEMLQTDSPPTAHPSLADPSPDNPHVVDSNILNTELVRNDSIKIEREHERLKEKHALNLAEFKRRWPTTAADDQTRVDNAWFALAPDEGEAALAGITPFLENQKRLKKSHPPAGFNYLGQKRWTLLEPKAETETIETYPLNSPEGRAVALLYDIAGKRSLFEAVAKRGVSWRKLTPQLLALAQAPPHEQWTALDMAQAAAWDRFVVTQLPRVNRPKLREGERAPWPWPPSVEGKLYPTGSGPPGTMMTGDDADYLNNSNKAG